MLLILIYCAVSLMFGAQEGSATECEESKLLLILIYCVIGLVFGTQEGSATFYIRA